MERSLVPLWITSEGVISLLTKQNRTAGDVLESVKQTPVNPFKAFDEAAGSRENLVEVLTRLDRAQNVRELLNS